MRLDTGFALLASMYANTHSKTGGYKVRDFAPYQDEPEIDLDTAMENWT